MFQWLRRLLGGAAEGDPLAAVEPGGADLRVIVGLGNPGTEYAATRHNLGFWCVDHIAQQLNATWRPAPAVHSRVGVTRDEAGQLVLAKPETFMNRSGLAVAALLERLHLEPERCLVVYDEMDLPFGTLRLRQRGSPGTHNGMRSVVAEVGTEALPRLRIGIGQARRDGAISHVLGEFSDEEQAGLDELVARAAEAALAWATEGAAVAMNRYNRV
jgi:PTH1 family peptidyl-tRNA hydrolase